MAQHYSNPKRANDEHADVQGIVGNDRARRIALDVIGDGLTDDDTYHVNSVMGPDGTATTYTVDGHACAWVRS